jgi:serine/threonine protein kinase/tetratricopeptide (TPR) repeat protein
MSIAVGTHERNQSLEEFLFEAALSKSSAVERTTFLDGVCCNNPGLRARLEVLLEGHFQAEGFLAASTKKVEQKPSPTPAENETSAIYVGRYKLLEKIGEGGFGEVWRAEQREPVKRRVALKIIKLGMDTKQVVARFEAERQALALMDHPNIAKVLDGGATDTGRPYFVMELVRGVRITDYCDQNQLSTGERLKLFIQVCRAIQHAHQKGIIHRDIKPSNILVTLHDGVPVPKVIDFGIAKATQMELTDKTVFTQFRLFLGTPAYVSPEQAEMSSVDIDTRSDIYSLGVLLYELLTGQTPFDTQELLKAGLEAMQKAIREQQPLRPSTRLSGMRRDALTTTAKGRAADPPRLIQLVRGDLDWIVMKCLEKERARRYETANDLALDLQRHLRDEPIVAVPPSGLYHVRKLVRRNKLTFTALAVVLLGLCLALGISGWSLAKERAARLRALAAEGRQRILLAEAQSEAIKSRQVVQFLKDTLQVMPALGALSNNAAALGAKSSGAQEALNSDFASKVRKRLDEISRRISRDFINEPRSEVELRTSLATAYHEAGHFELMEQEARKTLEVSRSRLGEQDTAVPNSLVLVGDALMHLGRYEQAEAAAREALDLQAKFAGRDAPAAVNCLNLLGVILQRAGRLDEAERAFMEVLAHTRKRLGETNVDTLGPLENVGLVHGAQGRFEKSDALLRTAEQELRRVLELRQQLLPEDHEDIATSLNNLACVLRDQGRLAEAESMCQDALTRRRRQLGDEHPATVTSLDNMASILLAQGRLAAAETGFQMALGMRRKRFGEEHPAVAQSLNDLAEVWRQQGKLAEAEDGFQHALALRRRGLGALHPSTLESLLNLLQVLAEQSKFEQGDTLLKDFITPELEVQPRSAALLNVRASWSAFRRH